ncbi:hypothetical protein I6N96_16250 [Enterococcus sp. BWM-S5]|uniref:LXG domain-containing protein n=1 Tax=Enterococcus larvae TaxID=2794352 RepID=A0ABS4CNS3_9ENTE|nr:T7SS effector LXG polymorphic toxin [Enterococcus larvae]MBP1047843.1 hypothetical protein [Enterococcus larvae]
MSIDMYLSEVRSQTSSAVQLANAYSQAIGAITDSCRAFMDAPLSGQTYDSAKIYFTTVYPPLVNGVTMVCEALTEAHQKFPDDFEQTVDSCDIKESELKEKIAQGKQVLQAQYKAIDSLEESDPALEQSIMRTQATIAKLEEKLSQLYLFNGSSPGIFSDVESLLNQLNQGISEVGKGSAWNASSGTFELNRMSLSWIQPLNEKWKERGQSKMDSELNKELKKYTLIECYDAFNNRVTWSIEHNGKRLDNPALQAYLKEIGAYLDGSNYDILQLTPKEWETRINNQWKNGTEYFNGTDVPWFFQGLGHIQDFVGKRQTDGTWDVMWSLGFTFANIRNIQLNTKGANFGSIDQLESHFSKHGGEFGKAYSNANEYLAGANNLMKYGTKVQYQYKGEVRTGYVKFMRNSSITNSNGIPIKSYAKFEFVGTNRFGEITTYHVESGKTFWKMMNNKKNIPVINPVEKRLKK